MIHALPDVARGPGDAVFPRQVQAALWSSVEPTPVDAPRLLAHSREMAAELGFSEADVASAEFAGVFGGNALLPGMQPFATNYGGHQFGHWAGQLGDGRAISLGEAVLADGQRRELQLKGAGPTPYSRSADGRAVLRSSIREFLCSEAMHHLGMPTTRALSLVGTGENVVRDMFYDGHPRPSRAPSSAGSRRRSCASAFRAAGARGEHRPAAEAGRFLHRPRFPAPLALGDTLRRERLRAWFAEVCERTARLMATGCGSASSTA
jgi:hypothetical protein